MPTKFRNGGEGRSRAGLSLHGIYDGFACRREVAVPWRGWYRAEIQRHRRLSGTEPTESAGFFVESKLDRGSGDDGALGIDSVEERHAVRIRHSGLAAHRRLRWPIAAGPNVAMAAIRSWKRGKRWNLRMDLSRIGVASDGRGFGGGIASRGTLSESRHRGGA